MLGVVGRATKWIGFVRLPGKPRSSERRAGKRDGFRIGGERPKVPLGVTGTGDGGRPRRRGPCRLFAAGIRGEDEGGRASADVMGPAAADPAPPRSGGIPDALRVEFGAGVRGAWSRADDRVAALRRAEDECVDSGGEARSGDQDGGARGGWGGPARGDIGGGGGVDEGRKRTGCAGEGTGAARGGGGRRRFLQGTRRRGG